MYFMMIPVIGWMSPIPLKQVEKKNLNKLKINKSVIYDELIFRIIFITSSCLFSKQ